MIKHRNFEDFGIKNEPWDRNETADFFYRRDEETFYFGREMSEVRWSGNCKAF